MPIACEHGKLPKDCRDCTPVPPEVRKEQPDEALSRIADALDIVALALTKILKEISKNEQERERSKEQDPRSFHADH